MFSEFDSPIQVFIKTTVNGLPMTNQRSFSAASPNKCVHNDDGYCVFQNLKLPKPSNFKPESDIPPESVTKISLTGMIDTLTSDLCKTFPNLIEFESMNTGIKNIEPDAFNNCQKLESLDLRHNNLTKLNSQLFKKNPLLKGLWLEDNQLSTIEPDLFRNTPLLHELDLEKNLLNEFPVSRMPTLSNLERIYLDANMLRTIDGRIVFKKFPNIKYLAVCDMNEQLDDSRLRQIVAFLKLKNVNTNCESDGQEDDVETLFKK